MKKKIKFHIKDNKSKMQQMIKSVKEIAFRRQLQTNKGDKYSMMIKRICK